MDVTEFFLSQFLKANVIDKEGKKIGGVDDVVVGLGEMFPRVLGLVVGKNRVLSIDLVEDFAKGKIKIKAKKDEITFTAVAEGQLLLSQGVLDKQIVDVNGLRVVRVNDIKLAKIGENVRVVAVGVGIKGILRHLRLEKFFTALLKLLRIKLEDNFIVWNFVEPFKSDWAKLKLKVPQERISKLHPADIAHIVSQVPTEERSAIFKSLSIKIASEALHELEPEVQISIVEELDKEKASDILETMPPDEAADVLGDLPNKEAQELLGLMKVEEAKEVRKLLKHEDESAGGLMTTEYISLPQALTAQEAIERLRKLAPAAETVYYVYVVDDAQRLVGVLSLRRLIVAKPERPISEIMTSKVFGVRPKMDQRQVAEIISKYNLLAVPVMDEKHKLLGIVTVDDIVDLVLPPESRRKHHRLG